MFRVLKHLSALVAIAFMVTATRPIWATTVIAARSPSRIILMSDSKAAFADNQSAIQCKIYVFKELSFALSGIPYDLRSGYRVETIVQSGFSSSGSFRQRIKVTKQLLLRALRTEIRQLKKNDFQMYRWAIRRDEDPLQIALAVVEKGSPHLVVLEYKLDWAKDPPKVFVLENNCPGSCEDGSHGYYLGQHDAINSYLASGAKVHFSDLPMLMQLEFADKPNLVGPPISILEITPEGRRWTAGGDLGSSQ